MPRSAIPVTALDRTGVAPPSQTNADATNKHTLANPNGRTLLEIVSSDAGAQTVTFDIVTAAVDGVAVPAKSVAVPAGATRMVGPFPKNFYNQTGDVVNVNPSVSTTLKFRAYSI